MRRPRLTAALLAVTLWAAGFSPVARGAEEGPAEPAQPAIEVTTPSVVVMEARSGKVLYAKNPDERRPPASVTKVMTLIVAFDALKEGTVSYDDRVTASALAASMGGTQMYLEEGETFTFKELLTAVAVGSANDAAVAVAEHVAGSHEQFVALMNEKARQLGLKNTNFVNATGLDADGQYMSALDMALMSRAATQYPELMELTKIYRTELQVPHRKNGPIFGLDNRNKLVRFYEGADGLKTGWTSQSGYCIAATAQRGGVRIIAALMGAPTSKVRQEEATRLLNYGFGHFVARLVAKPGEPLGSVVVLRGKQFSVDVQVAEPFTISLPRGVDAQIKLEPQLPRAITAPVEAGQAVGELVVKVEGEEVGRAPLVAVEAIDRTTFFGSLGGFVGRLFKGNK